MALIPPDAGIGMRMQAAADLLQPVTPIQEIPSDLPELRQGQTFSARIQEVLPENTYKALVAGKQITLQLPQGANAGDTLELVVIDRTPKVVIAQLAGQSATQAADDAYPYATLSKAGQMIGNLLLQEGETPEPVPLNRGQPVLSHPPAAAGELAPALAKAVSSSGLFYESHLVQWALGKVPTEQLLQEPQGSKSSPAAFFAHGLLPTETAEEAVRRTTAEQAAQAGGKAPTGPAAALMRSLFGGEETPGPAPAAAPQSGPLAQAAIPDDLRPLVQQQLDAAGTQRMIWHGEAWPNQQIKWEVSQEEERRAADGTEEPAAWRTHLSMESPRLGRVDAAVQLTPTGVRIALGTPYSGTAADLNNAAPALAASLEAAGITLLGFQVKHESGEQAA